MINALAGISGGGLPDLRMTQSLGEQAAAKQGGPGDFGAVLKDFASNAIDTLKQGEAAAISGIQGNLPLQSVVEHVMAAERTLQASIAIRDKLVTSYLEITRMQI